MSSGEMTRDNEQGLCAGSQFLTEAELLQVSNIVLNRLIDAEIDTTTRADLRAFRIQEWSQIDIALKTACSPVDFDWHMTEDRNVTLLDSLVQLARLKALLPEGNIEKQKDQHNVSLENYTKLALETAANADNLRVFLELIVAQLALAEENIVGLAQQALLIWVPASEIMGWHGIKTELEELAFARLYPSERQAIIDTYAHLGGDEALGEMVGMYKTGIAAVLGEELPNRNLWIDGRKKGYYSVWRKCVKDGRPTYALPDFFGIRIIVGSQDGEEGAIEDCYASADIVSQYFSPEIGRHKDYIARPKANGYQSLHLTLRDINDARLEVQIRSGDMHAKAEFDPNMSHMAYEASAKITPGRYFRKGLSKPQGIYTWREDAASIIRARTAQGSCDLRGLRPGKILVFRTDGNLYELDEGATALDLAFAVHSQRALNTYAVGVNGGLARFGRTLRYGDVVKIRYRDGTILTWNDDWLQQVNTPRAIKVLQRARKTRIQEVLISTAKIEIETYFKSVGISDPLGYLTDNDRRQIAEKYGVPNFEMVLREIGAGTPGFATGRIINRINTLIAKGAGDKIKTDNIEQQKSLGDTALKILRVPTESSELKLAVLRTRNCNYHFAGCCPEDQGQPVVAILSPSSGDFSIHSVQCSNLHPNVVRLPCEWYEQ